MSNTTMLNNIIDASGFKREFIAKQIGITRQSLNNKIENRTPFIAEEIFVLCDLLGISKMSDMKKLFFYTEVE